MKGLKRGEWGETYGDGRGYREDTIRMKYENRGRVIWGQEGGRAIEEKFPDVTANYIYVLEWGEIGNGKNKSG